MIKGAILSTALPPPLISPSYLPCLPSSAPQRRPCQGDPVEATGGEGKKRGSFYVCLSVSKYIKHSMSADDTPLAGQHALFRAVFLNQATEQPVTLVHLWMLRSCAQQTSGPVAGSLEVIFQSSPSPNPQDE